MLTIYSLPISQGAQLSYIKYLYLIYKIYIFINDVVQYMINFDQVMDCRSITKNSWGLRHIWLLFFIVIIVTNILYFFYIKNNFKLLHYKSQNFAIMHVFILINIIPLAVVLFSSDMHEAYCCGLYSKQHFG